MMAPDWALVPLVGLATLATVIASQALITGAFSVTKQVIQLGYLPRLNIQHTSVRDTGQIYMPLVNWGLFVAIVLAVVMFRSSSNLAAAYGIAVTLDMLITTTLTFFVIRYGWGYPLALCLAATGCFFVVDLAFFASNLLKLFQGGWFPLMIGGALFTLMMTWKQGRRLLNAKLRADAIDLKDFLESVSSAPDPGGRHGHFLTAEPGRFPMRCCTTSSTTRCCTSKTCSSRCATMKYPGLAWTSACRWSRWGMTAGRWWCTTASRTTLTCRVPWKPCEAGVAMWSR